MGRRKMPRVVIVYDGAHWFTRHLAVIRHDLDTDTKIYYCDAHLGGPYKTPEAAVAGLARCSRSVAPRQVGK